MIYPKIRNHVFHIALDQGVYFEGFTGAFLLKGEELWPWVEFLADHLDGTRSWREIVKGLPPAHRKVLRTIVKALIEHGFAYNAAHDLPHNLSPREVDHYQGVIQYLGEFAPSAEQRFEALRRAPVLLVGSGLCLSAAIRAALQIGAAHVDFADLAGDPQLTRHFLRPYEEWPARVTELQPGQVLEGLVNGPYRAVLFAGPLDHPFLSPLTERCQLLGTLLLIGGVTQDGGILLPTLHPDGPACWGCLTRTLTSHGVDLAAYDESPALLTLTASRLVYEWMLWTTEIKPPAIRSALVLIHRETLADTTHRVLPHPNCTLCGQHLMGFGVEALDSLVDPFTGYLHKVDPEELDQVPLAQCAAYLPPALGESRIVVAATDARQARERAVFAGLERFLTRHLTLSRDHTDAAVGRSTAEWVGRAVLRAAEHKLAEEARRGTWTPIPLTLGPNTCAASHRLHKALRILYGLSVDLYGCKTPWGGAAGVSSEGRWLSIRAGVDLAHAVHEALVAAAASAMRREEAVAECLHVGTAERVMVNVADGDSPDWQTWFDTNGHPLMANAVSLPGSVSTVLCGGRVSLEDVKKVIQCPPLCPERVLDRRG